MTTKERFEKFMKRSVRYVGSKKPNYPVQGDIYSDETTGKFYIFINRKWEELIDPEEGMNDIKED